MSRIAEVPVTADDPGRFRGLMPAEQFEAFLVRSEQAAARLRGVTVWNVNSTARGGGVAEMLRALLGYARGGGVDARWLVIQGEPAFFAVTKRIHNWIHGSPGDGGDLDARAATIYNRVLAEAAEELKGRVAPGDVVVLHDPQTAGLAPAAQRLGAIVVWRCHIGTDTPSDLADRAWEFLLPSLAAAEALVFSRRQFAWRALDSARIHVIPPSIDPFSPKNRDLGEAEADAILAGADVARSVPPGAPIVAQVSRWDRLKDPAGVLEGFAAHIAPFTDAHLVLAGPGALSVADDPESEEVLRGCYGIRDALPTSVRARAHLASLPMVDIDQNALMVNALQRRATVIVQKSLAEGFGLTVAEAMWKARPVVASRVGGIQDQIDDGRTGLLLNDPRDLGEFGQAVRSLLEQRDRAEAMGVAAHRAVQERYLAPRHLLQYADLLTSLVDASRVPG